MLRIIRLSIRLAILLNLIVIGNVATAANAPGKAPLNGVVGTINYIDTRQHRLIVDDRSYNLAEDLQVITPNGHKGRLTSLYPGKHIRMIVEFNKNSGNASVIHKIYMLK